MVSKDILLVHAGIRAYRIHIFNLLSRNFYLKFLFYLGKKHIFKFHNEWKEHVNKWDFEIMRPIKNLGYSYATPQLAWKIWDSKIIITSDISSFATHIIYALTRIKNKPLIVWGENWEWPETLAAKLLLPYVKRIARGCDAMIAAGSKAKEFFIELGANPEKIFIAPNAAERLPKPDNKIVSRLRKDYALKNKKVVLYLARIIRYKGLEFLLQAMKKIQDKRDDTILVIAGSGDKYEKECRAMAKELGLRNVHWTGYAPHNEVSAYYEIADVYVLPSVFRKQDNVSSEAWGLSLNEALSRHCPVVSTTAVAAAFDLIVNGKNGFQVQEKNPDALAKAIVKSFSLNKKIVKDISEEKISGFSFEKQFLGFKKAIDYVSTK